MLLLSLKQEPFRLTFRLTFQPTRVTHVARAGGAWGRGDQRWDRDGKTCGLKIDLNDWGMY